MNLHLTGFDCLIVIVASAIVLKISHHWGRKKRYERNNKRDSRKTK